MIRTKAARPFVDFSKILKSATIPDQSMSIQEIIRRFTRGIPADVIQRPKVFVDQSSVDLEKLSRMDATDKAFHADMMRADNERVQGELQRAYDEAAERIRERQEQAQEQASSASEGQSSNLDNTLLGDTNVTAKQLRGGKK